MQSRPGHRPRRGRSSRSGLAAAVAFALLVAACGPQASPTPPSPSGSEPGGPTPASSSTVPPAPSETFALPSFDPAALRWFCCLAAGEDPRQVSVEQQVAGEFARAFPGSSLAVEVMSQEDAGPTLAQQLSTGTAPDVVGPADVADLTGVAPLTQAWLDLGSRIAASHYDLGQYADAAVRHFTVNGGQVAIPLGLYPSALWYQAGMFEQAGLNPPPHRFGEPYTMPDGSQVEWSTDTLRQVAMRLTLDGSGRNATQAGFDPKDIVQVGFEPQRDDLRAMAAFWGPGSLVGPDGTSVVIPEPWKAAWRFFYDGMWTSHFILTGPALDADQFGGGLDNAFFSGRVAMTEDFLWATYAVAQAGPDWNLAAIPSFDGAITAPLDAAGFAIPAAAPNPDAAFAALTYLADQGSDRLAEAYGALPAKPERQDAFLARLAQTEGFPTGVDWQVMSASVDHADQPTFQAPTPNDLETSNVLNKYLARWSTTPGLDMDAEFSALARELQTAWRG